jgi:hypothetical protein
LSGLLSTTSAPYDEVGSPEKYARARAITQEFAWAAVEKKKYQDSLSNHSKGSGPSAWLILLNIGAAAVTLIPGVGEAADAGVLSLDAASSAEDVVSADEAITAGELAEDETIAAQDADSAVAEAQQEASEAADSGAPDELAPEESGGCASGQSFAAETGVVLASGAVIPISEVKVDDQVETTDPVTGKFPTQTVTRVWLDHDIDLMDVTISDGGVVSTIHSTQHHPFWDVTRHAWVNADQLVPGDQLASADGVVAVVAGTRIVPGAGDMWDLTVANSHDFYVVVTARSGECKSRSWFGCRSPA